MDLVLILIVSGVALAVVLGWSTYNRLMALDERCNTAFADVDVQLKHRHNLIPGLSRRCAPSSAMSTRS
ncbi:MAG: LemA family protein [Microvirga sp.]|nr:LemA family protein [Microvirga sp.]